MLAGLLAWLGARLGTAARSVDAVTFISEAARHVSVVRMIQKLAMSCIRGSSEYSCPSSPVTEPTASAVILSLIHI